jgi:uncharacterized protein YecE (DUF72 family)
VANSGSTNPLDTPASARFLFRDLHPRVAFGTASDRYAGWIGQIYTPGRWESRITRRTNVVGGRTFAEAVLPVECVEEYFRHFGALELDSTFYRPLLDEDLKPTATFFLLRAYAEHLRPGDRLVLKAPQLVIAPRVRRNGALVTNPSYLDADLFTHRFYAPAGRLLGGHLAGILFEQQYVRAVDRDTTEWEAVDLERFFRRIPSDKRYHVELRTESYLAEPVLGVLRRLGIGLAFTHWTWLPSLSEQFERVGRSFFNEGGEVLVRLMTPHAVRYADAYAKAHPFDKLVEGMLSERMLREAAAIMRAAIDADRHVTAIVNNRSGGNAPLIVEKLVEEFLNVPGACAP